MIEQINKYWFTYFMLAYWILTGAYHTIGTHSSDGWNTMYWCVENSLVIAAFSANKNDFKNSISISMFYGAIFYKIVEIIVYIGCYFTIGFFEMLDRYFIKLSLSILSLAIWYFILWLDGKD